MENKELIKFLKGKIVEEVFVTSEEKTIMSKNANESNWLFDFRSVLLDPITIDAYAEVFFEKYKNLYPFQVCGLEVAAIPLVSAIVMKSIQKKMPINGFFIRKSRKKTGLLNMIEGKINEEKIILVDDIINSGGSFLRQVEVIDKLRNDGLIKAKVERVFAILRFRDLYFYNHFHVRKIKIDDLFELNDFKNELEVENFGKKGEVQNFNEYEVIWRWSGIRPNFFYVVPKSAPLFYNGKIYFGTDSGHFVCLDSKTGDELWSYLVPFGSKGKIIFSSPCIYNDTIYFGSYDGNLYALDAQSGKRKWVFMEADWVGASPCVSEKLKLVFIGLEFGLFKKRGGVAAVDALTGKKKWEFRSPELTHGSPAYSEKYNMVCCGSNDRCMYTLDAKTGKLIWQIKTESEIKYAPAIDEERGLIVFGGIGGDANNEQKSSIYVCDIKTGSIEALYDDIYFGIYSTPVIYKNIVIVASLDKNIHAFDIKTGKGIWKYNTGARVFASPKLIEVESGVWRVFIGSNNARLHELDPETGEFKGALFVTERITNKVAYDSETKTIFVPTFANEIIAVKRK